MLLAANLARGRDHAFYSGSRISVPFLLLLVTSGLGACASTDGASYFVAPVAISDDAMGKKATGRRYGALTDGKYRMPAVNTARIAEHNLRQFVGF